MEMEETFDFGEFDIPAVEWPPAAVPELSASAVNVRKPASVVIFVIDISGSMKGARIRAVNNAIRDVLAELRQKETSTPSTEIRIAVLEFSTRAHWRTIYPESVGTFVWRDIEQVGGGTNYGQAFAALDEKLTEQQFMNAPAGAYPPLIVFLTDGPPSDRGLYREELASLGENPWFRSAVRAGIAIEEGALSEDCQRALTEFTEDENSVYPATNLVTLARQIWTVTLRGVDSVTRQDASPPIASPITPTNPIYEETAPTLPLGKIDWDSDFSF